MMGQITNVCVLFFVLFFFAGKMTSSLRELAANEKIPEQRRRLRYVYLHTVGKMGISPLSDFVSSPT